jgi:predicted CopG family antitoxin
MNQLQEHNLTKTIVVSEENYEKLKRLGLMRESFNDVISRLLETKEED